LNHPVGLHMRYEPAAMCASLQARRHLPREARRYRGSPPSRLLGPRLPAEPRLHLRRLLAAMELAALHAAPAAGVRGCLLRRCAAPSCARVGRSPPALHLALATSLPASAAARSTAHTNGNVFWHSSVGRALVRSWMGLTHVHAPASPKSSGSTRMHAATASCPACFHTALFTSAFARCSQNMQPGTSTESTRPSSRCPE
jgi:hypothetical protein